MALFQEGAFVIGCNYWASHAGTHMWSDWRPEVIEEDFAQLACHNIRLLRVFPLLSEFLPITPGYRVCGELQEFMFGEKPFPNTPEGRMGVSSEAMDKFELFCQIAEKYGMRLIVGLVTGWMSGRLFVPPAMYGANMLTNPMAVMWQVRFARTFVKRFADKAVIVAWDLGNECNCLGSIKAPEELYIWTSAIAGAIRTSDHTRPVISGMHGLLPEGIFRLGYQGELTDILTTHPYPLFTPYCDAAPLNSFKPALHATCQTLLYRGIGGKPCFVEEIGSLGNCVADEETAAAFARTCMFSLWAHDCLGFVWWCAFDQDHLASAPYDWRAEERELGIFRNDRSPKPVLNEMESFAKFLRSFAYPALPRRLVDGVCVLSRAQDAWANAYMSFALAKQAGIDIEYAYADQPLPEADCYFLPGVSGDSALYRREMDALMERVERGAALYISLDSGIISGFEKITGMHIVSRERANSADQIVWNDNAKSLPVMLSYRLNMRPAGARVLATDSRGAPIVSAHTYGKGKVFMVAAPVELMLAKQTGRMEDEPEYYKIYEKFIALASARKKAARIDKANVGLTEHAADENRRLLVMVNYDPCEAKVNIGLQPGWRAVRFLRGSATIPANDCAICEIMREP